MKVIDESLRQKMRILVDEFFKETGKSEADINSFYTKKMAAAGIDYKDYYNMSGGLRCFMEKFPEIIDVFKVSNNYHMKKSDSFLREGDSLGAIGSWMREVVSKYYNGKLLDSQFPTALRLYGNPSIKAI